MMKAAANSSSTSSTFMGQNERMYLRKVCVRVCVSGREQVARQCWYSGAQLSSS